MSKVCENIKSKKEKDIVGIECNLYEAIKENIKIHNIDQIQNLQKELFQINQTIPFSYQLPSNQEPIIETTFGVVPKGSLCQIVFPYFTPNQDELSTDENLIINSISINTSQAVNIERETHVQSESQTWFSERKFRLTASRFGETIYKMTHSRCQPTNLAKKLTRKESNKF